MKINNSSTVLACQNLSSKSSLVKRSPLISEIEPFSTRISMSAVGTQKQLMFMFILYDFKLWDCHFF